MILKYYLVFLVGYTVGIAVEYFIHRKKRRIYVEDRGKLLGYTSKECRFCGRVRVEEWENGDKICEKCSVNQDTGEFEQDYDI